MFAFAELGDADLMAAILACEHTVAAAQAEQLGLIAEVHRRAPGWIVPSGLGVVQLEPVLVVAAEIGPVLHLSPPTAAARVDLALGLTSRLPATVAALSRGDLDLPRARAILQATDLLTPQDAATVEAVVLPRATTQTSARVRASARRAAIAVCPAAAQERHQAAVADRQVRIFSLDDGVAQLSVTGPAGAVRGCFERITRLARDRQQVGAGQAGTGGAWADEGIDARRADLVLELLAAGVLHPTDSSHANQVHDDGTPDNVCPVIDGRARTVAATVAVTVDWQVLAGLSDDPGMLEGYGPITAAAARELADSAGSTWRRLLTDPRSGSVTEVASRSYRPPAALDRFVRVRDRTCRFPGCGQPTTRCDVDHTIRFPDGSTHADNLAALCRRHHLLKHHSRWVMRQRAGGVIEWVSPTGSQHVTAPPDVTPERARPRIGDGCATPGADDQSATDRRLDDAWGETAIDDAWDVPPVDAAWDETAEAYDTWVDTEEAWARIMSLADLHCPPMPDADEGDPPMPEADEGGPHLMREPPTAPEPGGGEPPPEPESKRRAA